MLTFLFSAFFGSVKWVIRDIISGGGVGDTAFSLCFRRYVIQSCWPGVCVFDFCARGL